MQEEESEAVRRFEIRRVTSAGSERSVDTVAAEEPLGIRIGYWFKQSKRVQNLALTMRTPGFDRELTAGLLLAEGVIAQRVDLEDLHMLGSPPQNEILAELAPHVDVESWRLSRDSIMNSSCGVCGKRSLEAIAIPVVPSQTSDGSTWQISRNLLAALPNLLAAHQDGFNQTGGLHAAALIDESGRVDVTFEDLGRHNALDKLTGHCFLRSRLPLGNRIVLLSSRSSFELVQKTVRAGGTILATVGGPSSLAIETARAYGLTLIGFLREGRFNVYSGDWRIK